MLESPVSIPQASHSAVSVGRTPRELRIEGLPFWRDRRVTRVYPPSNESAAELARRNPGWSTGIHLGLIGEWRGYRWRPVLPWDKVKSIVDDDGYWYASAEELVRHKPKLEGIEAELRAQVALAKRRAFVSSTSTPITSALATMRDSMH